LRSLRTRLLITAAIATTTAAPTALATSGSSSTAGAPIVAGDDSWNDQAAAIAIGFDEAWSNGDLDAVMAPFSPNFGCELYGGINQRVMRMAYEDLLEAYPDSTCETRVLGIARQGDHIQVKVCRLLRDADGAPVDEQCHALYLGPSREPRNRPASEHDLQILGLEEHWHRGPATIVDGVYRNSGCALSFEIAPTMFTVPAPRVGMTLDRVVLRSDDLDEEIQMVLLRDRGTNTAEEALEQDLRRWSQTEPSARLELRTEREVAGRPAYLVEHSYRGAGCSLQGSKAKASPRISTRVYVDVGAPYLLVIWMDRDKRGGDESSLLEDLLESIELHPDEGSDYAATVDRRHGFGRVPGGRFEASQAGLIIHDPELNLDQWSRNGLLCLTATEPGTREPRVYVDAIPLQCDDLTLAELVRMDDDRYLSIFENPDAAIIRNEPTQVGGRKATLVERSYGGSSPRHAETVVYVVHEQRQITLRVVGSSADVDRARPLLNRVQKAVDLVPARQ